VTPSRLNELGNPDNRYDSYGYEIWPDDPFKVDQLIWSVRRHCRPFQHQSGDPDLDNINQLDLLKNSRRWKLGKFFCPLRICSQSHPEIQADLHSSE
jgi:hypothetical protein